MSSRSTLLDYFDEIVVVDTEYRPAGDGTQEVRCVCALELGSGREHRLWLDAPFPCPYPVNEGSLLVAHYASAELATHDSLGWPRPANVLDTRTEFAAVTSGKRVGDQKLGLVDALKYFDLQHLHQYEKDDMRLLSIADRRNREYTVAERDALLKYCWSDVDGAVRLLTALEDWLVR